MHNSTRWLSLISHYCYLSRLSDNGGFAGGSDGRFLADAGGKTYWTAGSLVEASFSILANHGGGYS